MTDPVALQHRHVQDDVNTIKQLSEALIEVDYLISYGQILEARTLIEQALPDNQTLNNQRGIKNA